jgi:hypothetical protein
VRFARKGADVVLVNKHENRGRETLERAKPGRGTVMIVTAHLAGAGGLRVRHRRVSGGIRSVEVLYQPCGESAGEDDDG